MNLKKILIILLLGTSSYWANGQGRLSLSMGHHTYNIVESIDINNGRASGYHFALGYHRWVSDDKATRIFFVKSSLSSPIAPRQLGSFSEIVAGSNYRYAYSGLEIQRKYIEGFEADDPSVWYYGWGFGITSGTVTRNVNYLSNGNPSTETTEEHFYDLYPMGFIGYERLIHGRFIGFAEITLSASIRDLLFVVPKIGLSYRLY